MHRAIKLAPSFGNAVTARFPAEMAEVLGWRPGDAVSASIENGALVVRSETTIEGDAHGSRLA
jgi:antitoxin component of MazEF toxin-antitoxin module